MWSKKYKQVNKNNKIKILFSIFYFFIIVIAIAANKNDLYEEEEVSEIEARKFAKKIGAIFHLTSAADGTGVDDIFLDIGRHFIDPNNTFKERESINSVKLEDNLDSSGKKTCC